MIRVVPERVWEYFCSHTQILKTEEHEIAGDEWRSITIVNSEEFPAFKVYENGKFVARYCSFTRKSSEETLEDVYKIFLPGELEGLREASGFSENGEFAYPEDDEFFYAEFEDEPPSEEDVKAEEEEAEENLFSVAGGLVNALLDDYSPGSSEDLTDGEYEEAMSEVIMAAVSALCDIGYPVNIDAVKKT